MREKKFSKKGMRLKKWTRRVQHQASHLFMLLSYKGYLWKEQERTQRINIASLPSEYHSPLDASDHEILAVPITQLIINVSSGKWKRTTILHAYGKCALRAHEKTNCLTEVMIAEAHTTASNADAQHDKGESDSRLQPLAGVPVSLKDTVCVKGFDSCIGYSAWTGKPATHDAALASLLLDAGAIPFVKTAVPITLLSFESSSAVFRRCTNPHSPHHSPGGSSGGEAALIALCGSRVGIGTDVAGSVRIPAHYSGVYTVKASAGRFLKTGCVTSMPGQEGIPAVYSPMARTLEDLESFWKGVFEMKPWNYDHSVLEMPWRMVDLKDVKVRFGVMWDDGVVPPSPPCRRALEEVVTSLRKAGYEVVDFDPPDPYEGLKIAAQLLLADGLRTATSPIRLFEPNDPGMSQALTWLRLPSILQSLYSLYVRYIRRDPIYAGLLECVRTKSVREHYALVAERERYRAKWFEKWRSEDLYFLLCVPNALPAVPNGGMKKGWKACGYTFLFNLLDYTAGVLPVTRVDSSRDALSPVELKRLKSRNAISREAYEMYDAQTMHGLPIGVQVVGKRLEEERVLEGMMIVEKTLRERGVVYELLQP
ncbi:amidase signature enzyme [Rickenella mellea]|uniref:amidase n=1 Tax=Rickenella mellea TaxID=50990 RepID=A0A4Y7QCD6_9AGAM|nr:amidase signature enzyme [Rickenella mellea]